MGSHAGAWEPEKRRLVITVGGLDAHGGANVAIGRTAVATQARNAPQECLAGAIHIVGMPLRGKMPLLQNVNIQGCKHTRGLFIITVAQYVG